MAEDHVGGEREQVAHGQVPTIEFGDLHEVAQSAREPATVGLAKQAVLVLVDGTDPAGILEGAALAVAPFWMPSHGGQDLLDRFAMGRPAQVEDGEALQGLRALEESGLDRRAQRMLAPLPVAQIAEPLEDLAMVRCDYGELSVLASKR